MEEGIEEMVHIRTFADRKNMRYGLLAGILVTRRRKVVMARWKLVNIQELGAKDRVYSSEGEKHHLNGMVYGSLGTWRKRTWVEEYGDL